MKPIAIPRPDDPEGQALWDQTREILEQRPARLLSLLTNVSDYDQTAEEAEAELRADGVDVDAFIDRVHSAIACLCGKRTTCACRMRLPVVDVETGSDDE